MPDPFKRDELEAKLVDVMSEHCKNTLTLIPRDLKAFVYDNVSDFLTLIDEEAK